MIERKTIELNIPRTAEERAKASNEWHCAGCGAPVPDLVKRCDCSTMVACKEGVKSVWMIDPNESPCVINLRNCQTQLDADGCQVGVSRQALEETLADYSRLRAEVERLTKARDDEKARAEILDRQLTTALAYHDAAYNDSLAAEKARDEALAELSKALETLGQLRSDLQRVAERHAQTERDACMWAERAQSAEAFLAKLRETSAHVVHDIDDLVSHSQGVAGLHLNGDIASWGELTEGGRFEGWLGSLEAIRSLLGETPDKKFPHLSRVEKIKGSSWRGRVVGFYSTSLTPDGYCVESENEPGSVQIYPENALRALLDEPDKDQKQCQKRLTISPQSVRGRCEALEKIATYPNDADEVPKSHKSDYLISCMRQIAHAALDAAKKEIGG